MRAPAHDPTLEHPLEVLEAACAWMAAGERAALALLTGVEGGGVRAPGALLAVGESGRAAGYLSGGCIDADLILQARAALGTRAPRRVRYGSGSPYLDVPLPCGGALDIALLPDPPAEALARGVATLRGRRPVWASVAEGLTLAEAPPGFCYSPKLRLRLCGRGAEVLALARLARAARLEVRVQSTDAACLAAAAALGAETEPLATPRDLPPLRDDAWTAFVLLAHDPDWEGPLLAQALGGPACYLGAVGSRRAQARLRGALGELGCAPQAIAQVRGPVGLLPRMRDASTLAVSILAEILSLRTDS